MRRRMVTLYSLYGEALSRRDELVLGRDGQDLAGACLGGAPQQPVDRRRGLAEGRRCRARTDVMHKEQRCDSITGAVDAYGQSWRPHTPEGASLASQEVDTI